MSDEIDFGPDLEHPRDYIRGAVKLYGPETLRRIFEEEMERGIRCESPIELAFFDECIRVRDAGRGEPLSDLVAQFPAHGFRLDFALPSAMIAIELDGHEFHKTREQRTYDAKRERELTRHGWRVLRFTGTEITRDVAACVAEVLRAAA